MTDKPIKPTDSHEFDPSGHADPKAAAWDRVCANCGSHTRTPVCRD